MNMTVVVFLVAILLIGAILFIVLMFTRSGGKALNKQEFQTRWLAIQNSVKKDDTASYHMAILNADKLVDKALRDRRFKGATMGERMKSADKCWKNANAIWTAHKVRNKIAHEPDVHVSHELAVQSLAAFKQALHDLEAI